MHFWHQTQFNWLKKRYPPRPLGTAVEHRRSLESMLGADLPLKVKDRVVVDFGCGLGADTAQLARWGAKLAIGLEIRNELVQQNRTTYSLANCQFHTAMPRDLTGTADMVISVDAFEHFSEPDRMLQLMYDVLRSGGEAHLSFGPLWLHPYGGHFFSVFPWAHLLLSEQALVAWRNLFFKDQATSFETVSGGLNRMTVSRFKAIVESSPFKLLRLECPPIKGRRWLQRLLGVERGTSEVRAILVKP